MNEIIKNRRKTFSIIISFFMIFTLIIGIIFIPKINSVKADEYNYGEFNEQGYYILNGVTFYGIKVRVSENKDEEKSDYWRNYEIVKQNDKAVFIKFGETVLLKEDEAILINFARQTDDGSGFVCDENGQPISSAVDFLNAEITVDGVNENNVITNEIQKSEDDSAKKYFELGYLIDPHNIFDGVDLGVGVNSQREGKVEFFTSEYEINEILNSYSFMFYVFKYDTYNRTEAGIERPNTIIGNTVFVNDASTQENFYSEHFYFYENQNLPYIEYNPFRYEISISKTIHRNAINYNFLLDNNAVDGQNTNQNNKITTVVDELDGNKVVQTITQTLSTLDVYARALRIEKTTGDKLRIYFENLGEYVITYKAVYYDEEIKINLENLNQNNKSDKLTISGVEATYQDYIKGQTPFRNESNTIYADLTGIIDAENIFKDQKLNYTGTIASTNQPPIKFMFNNSVIETTVHYSLDNSKYTDTEGAYKYTSNFEKPGFYVVILKSQGGYKITTETGVVSQTKEVKQIFIFQIKEQTPNLNIFKIDENGNIFDDEEKEEKRVYSGMFVNNGVQIIEFEKTNEFDSEIRLELTKKGFGQADSQSITISLPNEDYNKLTAEQISTLAKYGITKGDRYYVLKPSENISVDGEYSLTLRFGNSGKETTTFKLDTQPITGMKTYTAQSVYGTNYFKTNFVSGEGNIALTNTAFTIFWNNKASGAKINAKFVRFAIEERKYDGNANNYILNNTYLATDFSIKLANNNPETLFEKAISETSVETQSVLSFSGLYIFKLEDEAGNIAYYSVLLDNTSPTVLQKPMSGGGYEIINGVNNVVEATTLFFGTKKAIPFLYEDGLVSYENLNTIFSSEGSTAITYLKQFFNKIEEIDKNSSINEIDGGNIYFLIDIKNIYELTGNGAIKEITFENGIYNCLAPLDENGKLIDVQFYYQIFDASNQLKKSPSRTYPLRFNSDQTGLLLFTDSTNIKSELQFVSSSVINDDEKINYYKPTTRDIVYLSWESLFQTDLGVFVDIGNDGLICNYYPLVYDKEKNSYRYSDVPTRIYLDLDLISDDQLENGYDLNGINVALPINVINGQTQPGKYVITRTYSPLNAEEPINLGNDYKVLNFEFYVDRAPIISANNSDGERNGYYSYITTFDGGDDSNKVYFNELYRQSQYSINPILQTNKLPIGFYIPLSKYGYVSEIINGDIQETGLNLEDVQSSNLDFKFLDLVQIENIEINDFSLNATYNPFKLTVFLISPSGIYYYYSYNSANGYFMLSGYSLGELGVNESAISISNPTNILNINGLTGNSQYETGIYNLKISCIQDSMTNEYYQTFNIYFEVIGDGPVYEMTAKYPDLENVDDREIQENLEESGITYYTNGDQITINWETSNNKYLANIDLSKINYTVYIGGQSRKIPNPNLGEKILIFDKDDSLYYSFDEKGKLVQIDDYDSNPLYVIKIEKQINSYTFTLTVPENSTKLLIETTYEVYSYDLNKYYSSFYPNNNFKVSKTILIDRAAPTTSINNLKMNDETVKDLNIVLFRKSDDSRYSKSNDEGMFKYYSFITNSNYLIDLSKSLKLNLPTETKTFYYRNFNEKYNGSAFKETGLGYDKTSSSDNLFSEYFATSSGWKKVTEEIDQAVFNGYYEVVEMDLAGNMTIYSIYIGDSRDIELGIARITESAINGENGTININNNLDDNKINAIVKFGADIQRVNDIVANPIKISSYDNFKIDYVKIKLPITAEYDFYRYLKIIINGEKYYLTPENFTNIGSDSIPNIACITIYNSSGEKIKFSEIELMGQERYHEIGFVDTVNKSNNTASNYMIQAMVAPSDDRLTDNGGAVVKSDVIILDDLGNIVSNSNLTLVLSRPLNPSLNIDESSIKFFKINSNGITYQLYTLQNNTILKQQNNTNSGTTTYYYIPSESDFFASTFLVVYKDNFGNEYRNLIEYKEANYDRFEGNYDINEEDQSKSEILASGQVSVNISNLFNVIVTDINGKNVAENLRIIDSSYLGASYTQYQLLPITSSKDGYYGGKIIFKLVLNYNIPEGIYNELSGEYNFVESGQGAVETIYVTIYNQLPEIKIIDSNGKDITNPLLNNEITQSEEITIYFNSGNSISESIGYNSKVFINLRGSENGFIEIKSPYTVSEPGIYDIYIQNFDEEGNSLDFVIKENFIISDLDVMFYTVVKTNENDEKIIVSPTNKPYIYNNGNSAIHYIINTDKYNIITNGDNVKKNEIYRHENTVVYEIYSNVGTIYKERIAISVVESTNNILGSSFIWFLGENYYLPQEENYINSTTKDIFLGKNDNANVITLRWPSYYSIQQNKIICYSSNDDGVSWNKVNGYDDGTFITLTLSKSSSLIYKFEDLAGNIQHFSTETGNRSFTTKVNFIRSVIFNINGKNPIDNSVYNSNVVLNIPTNTLRFYSTQPNINIKRNNQPYSLKVDSSGNYIFNETGVYEIWFSAKVETGNKDLNEDVISFSIINANDSRWAFNYVNYNGYEIKSIKYNDVEIPQELLNRALMVKNEINISAFDIDSLGNRWFNNGKYTITLSCYDKVLGEQEFSFDFWLNDEQPPINISLPEHQSTTGSVSVEFNRNNIYSIIGDSYIQINGEKLFIIDQTTIGTLDEPYVLSNPGTYYVQIYTSSGKLVYSHQVRIDKPLDTMTIIIIVVSVVVVAVGVLIFVLLRKKMQVR